MADPHNWLGPYKTGEEALDALRRTIAEIIGADPEKWPDHGNAPLAIAAGFGLRAAELKARAPTQAARDVLAERRRQIEAKGWTPEHDDEHVLGEIAALAAFYAVPDGVRDWDFSSTGYGDKLAEALLPNGWTAKAGEDRRRDLVKAGALILAEIERLDRSAQGPSAIAPPAMYGCGGDPLDDARYDKEMERARAALGKESSR